MTSIQIKAFCFNPFYENTYLLYNESGSCWIVDPGCYNEEEQTILVDFIKQNNLQPERILLTHAHIDHIFGCAFLFQQFQLKPELHLSDLEIYNSGVLVGGMYGVAYVPGPKPINFLKEGDILNLGGSSWKCIFCPGHSPGSLCFYNQEQKMLIGGDVLFEGSIGRTDLPGGNHNDLIRNIRTRLFVLDKDVVVYPGHGGITTIGQEVLTNPFFD